MEFQDLHRFFVLLFEAKNTRYMHSVDTNYQQ